MPEARIIAAALAFAALCASSTAPSHAQSRTGLERLYILNCGEGVADDISRWSPGVNEGKSMDFVDNCYLIKHAEGWMLWDTGVADAIADMPDGQKPADPRATHWKRPNTLRSQLAQLGVKGGKDVFGDGSVMFISTPGHTPGHQSLLVKLPKAGARLLSGDAVHLQSNWENRRVPAINSHQGTDARVDAAHGGYPGEGKGHVATRALVQGS